MTSSTALITGASSGLGRGLALYFARRNVKVYAAARRVEQLDALKAEAGEGHIIPLPLDVSDADAAFERIAALDDECGGLDLVIANAGVGVESYGKRINWPGLSNMLKVNVLGATATLTAPLAGMVKRGRGHLVGISSLAAYVGLPRTGGYSGTKAYLATFLDGLRIDLAPLGVHVTSIHPGFVKSELTATSKGKLPFLLETDDAVERMGKAIERREAVFNFPWQMTAAVKLIASLPRGLSSAALKKMR